MITNFIQLDFNKENDLKVPSVQYDSGSRFVKIKLQRNKSPFEIDGYRVTVVANKVDGTEIMNDCTILDGVNGIVQFEITEQFNAVEGVVDCQLKLFKGETLLTSMPFSINVVKSVSTKEIVSSNELKTLVNALGEVQNIDNRFAQTNAQLSELANKGTTVEVLERVTKEEIDRQIADGTLANLTLADNSVTSSRLRDGAVTIEKLSPDVSSLLGKSAYPSCNNEVTNKYHYDISEISSPTITIYDESNIDRKFVRICEDNLFNMNEFTTFSDFMDTGAYRAKPIYLSPNTTYTVKIIVKNAVESQKIGSSLILNTDYDRWQSTSSGINLKGLEKDRKIKLTTNSTGCLYLTPVYSSQNDIDAFVKAFDIMIYRGDDDLAYKPYIGYDIDLSSQYSFPVNNNKNVIINSKIIERHQLGYKLPNPANKIVYESPDYEKLSSLLKIDKTSNGGYHISKKPLFIELGADFYWVSERGVPAFDSSDQRFIEDGHANNGYFKIIGEKGDDFVTIVSGGNAVANDIKGVEWWGAVIGYGDGRYEEYNAKYRDDNTISIHPSLKESITDGELGNIATGIHLSARGYKAYIQRAFNTNPKWCEKDKYVAKYRPRLNEDSPFNVFGGMVSVSNDLLNMTTSLRTAYTRRHLRVGFPWGAEHQHNTPTGIEWETNLKGQSGYLELFLGGRTDSVMTYDSGYEIIIEVYIDDSLVKKINKSTQRVERICVDYVNAEKGRLKIYSNKWKTGHGFTVSDVTWWVNELTFNDDKIIPKFATVAQIFDSWGTFHGGVTGKEMSRLINQYSGVSVPYENHSKGSQTSAWGKAWFYENVKRYNPSHMITDFAINDHNSGSTSGFPKTVAGPDGTEYKNILTAEEYKANMLDLAQMALVNNIQPIIFGGCMGGVYITEWYLRLTDGTKID